MSLISCPGCDRHVRTNETACPFCQADIADAISRAMPRPVPMAGMSRTAMMAFAAASLGAAACSGKDVTPGGGNQPLTDGAVDGANGNGGASNTGGQMAMPVYGAPFPTGGMSNTGVGGVQALYGAPPPPPGTGGEMNLPAYGISPFPASGGTSNVGGTPNSAGTGGIMAVPLYGASPIPPKP
jgi:hypothetical protein